MRVAAFEGPAKESGENSSARTSVSVEGLRTQTRIAAFEGPAKENGENSSATTSVKRAFEGPAKESGEILTRARAVNPLAVFILDKTEKIKFMDKIQIYFQLFPI